MRKVSALALLLLFLSACSMPETRIYSLYTPVGREASNNKAKVSVAIILEAPRYLAQPYIAHRSSPYQLVISKYSKWDSAPNEIMKGALRDYLYATGLFKEIRTSGFLPVDFYALKIKLKKFEMYDTAEGSFGELAFDAELISPGGMEQYRGTVYKKVKLGDKTFLGLAKGLSSALSEGIEEVKDNIVKILTASKL